MAEDRIRRNCEEGPNHCVLYGSLHKHRGPAGHQAAGTPLVPTERHPTQVEWEAALERAKKVQADDLEAHPLQPSGPRPGNLLELADRIPDDAVRMRMRTRTARRRSWWQRGWGKR